MQHQNTHHVIRGGLKFFGYTFLEGAGFWAVNLTGAKMFWPSLLK